MATGKINAQLLGVKVQLPCQQNRHQRRQHNTKKHKSSCKEISPPEVQMNLHEFIGLDCNNRRVCRTLHYSIPSSHIYRNNGNFSWSWTLFPPSTTWSIQRWTQENNQSFQMGWFSYLPSPYELHTIVSSVQLLGSFHSWLQYKKQMKATLTLPILKQRFTVGKTGN